MDPKVNKKEKWEFLDSILKSGDVKFEHLVLDSFGNYVIQKVL